MLYSIEDKSPISNIPHAQHYNLIRSRLSQQEFNAITDAINSVFNGVEVQCASFIPGAEWEGTPYMPLYENVASGDFELAAKLFGLMVWVTLLNRQDTWSFGRYPLTGRDIEGMTYFRVDI